MKSNVRPGLTRGLIALMAAACGFAVANVYLNQTLLVDITGTFGATEAEVAIVTTLTQVGYALGNLILVPLGDIFERRRLILALLGVTSLSLVSAALSGSITWLIVSNFCLGFTTVIPQIIVPLAAGMADERNRGKVLGTVAIGLVCGILGARFVSGLVDSFWGWRSMYWISFGCTLLLALLIQLRFPVSKGTTSLPYRGLLLSLGPLFIKEGVLRRACLSQGMVFGSFSVFFTTIGFMLQAPPHSYSSAVVGLVGLVGIGGAIATPLIGRIIDKKGASFANKMCMLVALISFLIAAPAGHWLPALILAAFLLTVGTQANQVACQANIFNLSASARSRLNGLYMVCTFLGGALGSYLGVWAWSRWHWMGVCICGMVMISVGLSTALGNKKWREQPQTISS
ncbi:putative MFS family arabinose efflux permease [Paenibacillus brasilensis]|uniref:MFS family arabinose efflux permease n=2 Tax=Paenibacillus TaxID=44249 RepID=A0ABU0KWC0_9BACL|nr:putative MFS family arabinose efflux permease [Paenibacillus brasilensis]